MSRVGDQIGAEIAADIAARSPWPSVGDAVAARLVRTLYYFSAAAVGTFPQSLQGTCPTANVLTANPTRAAPAVIAQAAMPVGVPNLAIWPAHALMLHLWTFAPLLPIGEKYSILATIKQVDANGATVATLKAYPINGDVEFPDDIWSPNWARTDLAVELPQLAVDAGLRLAIDVTVFTSCVSALAVQLQIGGVFASYIDTSLMAVGGGGGPVSSVESLDDSIAVTNITSTLQNIQVPVSTAIPTNDAGMGSAGTSRIKSNDDHQHPLGSPADSGGKVWTAFVQDAYQRPSVDSLFRAAGGCAPSLFQGFTQIATGVWRKDTTDPMVDTCDTDGVTPFVGMRVLSWSGALSDEDRALSGPYVVANVGGIVEDPVTHVLTYNHAQLHRAPDADSSAEVYHGIYQAVLGGTIYGGMIFQLSTADPIELNVTPLTWAIIDPPSIAATQELLTAAQLGLASPVVVTAVVGYVSPASGELDLVTCTQHDAALGGTVLSGIGTWRFHVPIWLTANDPAATTVVRCYVRGDAHTPWVLVATTQSLHNESMGVFVAAGTLGSDYALGIGEKLQVRYAAVSDSAAGVIVNLRYNDVPHTGYIEIPAIIGYTGTDDHQQLINRGTFLAPANAPILAHPMSAIEPGRVHSPTGATVDTVDGILTMPESNTCRVGGSDPLRGIAVAGWQKGDEILLWFNESRTIQGLAPGIPDGCAVLALGAQFVDPANTSAGQQIGVTSFSCLHLMYDGGVNWYLSAPPVIQ